MAVFINKLSSATVYNLSCMCVTGKSSPMIAPPNAIKFSDSVGCDKVVDSDEIQSIRGRHKPRGTDISALVSGIPEYNVFHRDIGMLPARVDDSSVGLEDDVRILRRHI